MNGAAGSFGKIRFLQADAPQGARQRVAIDATQSAMPQLSQLASIASRATALVRNRDTIAPVSAAPQNERRFPATDRTDRLTDRPTDRGKHRSHFVHVGATLAQGLTRNERH
jgi:hypothetical protein